MDWFLDEYLPRHKIILNVDHIGLLRNGVFGWVWAADCDHRPRDFEMEIHNRMNPEDYTKTLLHELWHIYQHVQGDLKDKRSQRLWKGVDHSKTDYEDQPWEVEAHKMEDIRMPKITLAVVVEASVTPMVLLEEQVVLAVC